MKILIVDDSSYVRDVLHTSLKTINSSLVIEDESTYKGGLRHYCILEPEIVILDIALPDESGIKLLQKIKEINRKTAVIIFSNYATDEFIKNSLENGADYFFDKSKDYLKMLKMLKNFTGFNKFELIN